MGMHQYLVIFLILFNAEVVYVFLPQDKIISFCNRNIDMETAIRQRISYVEANAMSSLCEETLTLAGTC